MSQVSSSTGSPGMISYLLNVIWSLHCSRSRYLSANTPFIFLLSAVLCAIILISYCWSLLTTWTLGEEIDKQKPFCSALVRFHRESSVPPFPSRFLSLICPFIHGHYFCPFGHRVYRVELLKRNPSCPLTLCPTQERKMAVETLVSGSIRCNHTIPNSPQHCCLHDTFYYYRQSSYTQYIHVARNNYHGRSIHILIW